MASVDEILESVSELNQTLQAIDSKLDDVKAKIAELEAGTVVSQEQIDAISAAVQEAKTAASNVLSESEDL